MSTVAEKQLTLLTLKMNGEAAAKAAAAGDFESTDYKKAMKSISKTYNQGMKLLRTERRAAREATPHEQALAELDLTNQTYSAIYQFDTIKIAAASLRALSDDWVTGASGRHGGNKQRQHHGGPRGCFMITANKHTKIATLYVADTNENDLPSDMDGAREIEVSEDDDDDVNESTLALLIAAGGQALQQVKDMDEAARKAHASKLNGDRSVQAKDVTELAEKMGCPTTENTKLKRLTWMLVQYLD